jgi:hypothetical protein
MIAWSTWSSRNGHPRGYFNSPVNFMAPMSDATRQKTTSELIDSFGGLASEVYFQRARDPLAAKGKPVAKRGRTPRASASPRQRPALKRATG